VEVAREDINSIMIPDVVHQQEEGDHHDEEEGHHVEIGVDLLVENVADLLVHQLTLIRSKMKKKIDYCNCSVPLRERYNL